MKSIRKENGVITILTLVSILFMVSFLISTYIIVANKVKSQKDTIAETGKIYKGTLTMDEIYNSYFNDGNIIPIYTVDQLLDMGKETTNVNIKGKYYNFTNNENTIYVLMNDLEFRATDYPEKLKDGYWNPVGDEIANYENKKNEGVDEKDNVFKAKFEGKNNKIKVLYKDKQGDEYSITYSKDNNYCEPEYEVNITPKLPDGNIATEAKIYKEGEDTGLVGECSVKVKRLNKTNIKAILENGNYNIPEISILIENPNKIEDLNINFENLIATLTIETTTKVAI